MQRLLPIHSCGHHVPLPGQPLGQKIQIQGIVIDGQDPPPPESGGFRHSRGLDLGPIGRADHIGVNRRCRDGLKKGVGQSSAHQDQHGVGCLLDLAQVFRIGCLALSKLLFQHLAVAKDLVDWVA